MYVFGLKGEKAMMSQWMIVFVAFFVSFVLTSFLFSKLEFFKIFRLNNFSAVASVILGSVISSIGFLSFYWNENDFVTDVSVWEFLAPLVGLAIIFATCLNGRIALLNWGILFASIIGVFGGDLFIEFIPSASVFVNKLCSVVVWTLFSIGIRCVAVVYPVLQIQGVTFSAGIVLLYFFGAMPFMLTVVGATLLASTMVAYLNYYKQSMGVEVSSILGFFIGWFCFVSYDEMLLPCVFVLIAFCLVEMSVCFIRKASFLEKYKSFLGNAVMLQIYESGFPALGIIKSLWILSGVVIIFSVFQANGVNNYSIPVFIVLVVLWHFYKMLNWQEKERNWKDTKQAVVDDVKTTITQIIDYSKDMKQKRDKKDLESNVSLAEEDNKDKSVKTKLSKTKKASVSKKETVKASKVKKSDDVKIKKVKKSEVKKNSGVKTEKKKVSKTK